MKCEICHQQEAQTVWFRKREDGTLEELYVCHACAERERVFGQERGIQVATMEEPEEAPQGPLTPEALGLPREMLGKGMQEAFEQLSEKLQEMGITAQVPLVSDEACKQCGMPLDEIRLASRIGCAKCLEQFRATIEAMIEEAQGCGSYGGPPPNLSARQEALERLRRERQQHIANEDYRAAKQCDEAIKALEAQPEEEAGEETAE
ncbi:MAG: hypothetical protein Q4C03_00605 [bacterium]|nr:hypothetical protein [bacterium]MDO5462335.1 hypothetical protein [bacterium]